MRLILIGATGLIGSSILAQLKNYPELEIVTVSRTGGSDLQIDISSPAQIRKMYQQAGTVDAVISAAGDCWLGPFDEMTEENFYVGIKGKMMGQINLVMIGKEYINTSGSFTLTSGFLSDDPIKGGINYSIANGAIDNFVLAASIELSRGLRINAVSPGWVVDNYDGRMDKLTKGQYPVAVDKVVHAYYKSAFGYLTGQVFRVWEPSTQYLRK